MIAARFAAHSAGVYMPWSHSRCRLESRFFCSAVGAPEFPPFGGGFGGSGGGGGGVAGGVVGGAAGSLVGRGSDLGHGWLLPDGGSLPGGPGAADDEAEGAAEVDGWGTAGDAVPSGVTSTDDFGAVSSAAVALDAGEGGVEVLGTTRATMTALATRTSAITAAKARTRRRRPALSSV